MKHDQNMATFHPNPSDRHEPWIERSALEGWYGLRIWHVVLMVFASFLGIVILICCCVKLRIPRTKQEIEAHYRRKKLVKKFQERVELIQNQDMDELDLKKVMDIIQEDYKTEMNNLEEYNVGCDVTNNLKAEPQQPSRLNRIMLLMKFNRPRNTTHPEVGMLPVQDEISPETERQRNAIALI